MVCPMLTLTAYPGQMGEAARLEQMFGRYQEQRLRLGMPARLITLDRTASVVLDDLSESGAKITLPAPHDFVVCVLRWMEHHGFANVRWRDGLTVGLQFDKPLCPAILEDTRRDGLDHAIERTREPALRHC